ncbi:MAG TPA: MBL fold metallo-hydrolase [Aggregatilineales bacterium]|nr:MBL fold metallo-hydrolase [Aggregatilineales bacterium]
MAIKIVALCLGLLQTNCYIVGDTDSREAVVIDPSDEASAILDVLAQEQWVAREILATHSHFDHILAAGEVKAATGAPFRLHRSDLQQLRDAPQMTMAFIGKAIPAPPEPDGFVDEGDTIRLGSITLETLFTPGHSSGHVSFVLPSEYVVFSGDCLFLGSIGRTDLPGGDYTALMRSIAEKLLPLGDDFTVAAGHGQATTIGRERMSNPFLFDWLNSSHP